MTSPGRPLPAIGVFNRNYSNAVLEEPRIAIIVGYPDPTSIPRAELADAVKTFVNVYPSFFPTASGLFQQTIRLPPDDGPGHPPALAIGPDFGEITKSGCSRLIPEFIDTQTRARFAIAGQDILTWEKELNNLERIVNQMAVLCVAVYGPAQSYLRALRDFNVSDGLPVDIDATYESFLAAARKV